MQGPFRSDYLKKQALSYKLVHADNPFGVDPVEAVEAFGRWLMVSGFRYPKP